MDFLQFSGVNFLETSANEPGFMNFLYVSILTLLGFITVLQTIVNTFSVLASGDIKFMRGNEYRRFTLFLTAQILALVIVGLISFTALNVINYAHYRLFYFAALMAFFGVSALALKYNTNHFLVISLALIALFLCGLSVWQPHLENTLYSIGLLSMSLLFCLVVLQDQSDIKGFFLNAYRVFSISFCFLIFVQVLGFIQFSPMIASAALLILAFLQWCLSVSSLWTNYTQNVEARNRAQERDAQEEKKKLEAIFRDLHDEITGCPNDGFLVNYLNGQVEAGNLKSFALFCIRVRGLRPVQNALGIDIANGLLKSCAQRLAVIGHAIDDFITISDHENHLGCVIRSEGREFFMVSKTTALPSIQRFCDKINETFSVPFEFGGLCLDLQANIGVSLFPDHGWRPQLVMQHANVAVDIAKRGSYESILFDPLLDPSLQRRLILLGDLRGALNRGDIFLTYQPQICLLTNQVLGVEALIRWSHPFLGAVPPDEFIALAEQTGMIKHITRWVCDHAAMDFVRLSLEGLQLKMSINVSPNNLLEDNFATSVLAILEEYEIPSGCFCVELTETAVMLDPERVMASIEHLTRHGVVFSIDDFGTGFSSLVNLKRLKVRQLKIDKDFISNLEFDTEDEAIVRATIEMANCLGVQTVAEGVETLAVIEKLKVLGCNIIQGHYISRAIPIDELIDWLASRPNQTQKIKHLVS